MPEILPTPNSAPRRRRSYRRPTIQLTMAVVAVVAVALGAIRYEMAKARRVRIEALKAQLAQAEARSAWSQRMRQRGYVTAAQAASARLVVERARHEMEAFEGR